MLNDMLVQLYLLLNKYVLVIWALRKYYLKTIIFLDKTVISSAVKQFRNTNI